MNVCKVLNAKGELVFYMQCLDEEAAVTASTAALDEKDMIMAQYREHVAIRYRGFTLYEQNVLEQVRFR
jgi:TPP-dependent pyruvate/acetoin dehydrogenase alpha subunit